jgi:peroxiredoxin
MHAWAQDQNVGDSVQMIGDGNGTFTEAMGLVFDGSGIGLGSRSQRYAAVLQDGVVEQLLVEPKPGVEESSVENVLAHL